MNLWCGLPELYVVRDIRAAMDHWVNVMGVGPWYYIDRVKTDYFRHRGEDSAMEMSVALANSGDLQIELIQQRNDAPSMYKEFLDSGREGPQHMSYSTRDYQALYDRALSLGYKVGHEGQIGGEKGRFAYSIRRPIRHRRRDIRHQRQQGEFLRAYPQGRRRLGRLRSYSRSRRTLSDARIARSQYGPCAKRGAGEETKNVRNKRMADFP